MTCKGTVSLRVVLGLLILSVSIFVLIWGFVPLRREMRVRPIIITAQLALPEKRNLSILFPPNIRTGDVGIVRLTLGVDALSSTTQADGGNTSTGSGSKSSNFYDTHHVIIETRFDLPGMDIHPSDLISAPIAQGQTPVFYWTLRPHEAGTYKGTIWLYLRTVDKATGEERRETVSAQNVEIDGVDLLGLQTNPARIVGLAGTVIGLALSLPFFETLLKIPFKKAESRKIG